MTASDERGAVADNRSTHTLRLTFRYDGEEVELVDVRSVHMVTPPEVGEPPEQGRHGGSWVELQDESGYRLFTRVLHDPFRTAVEVHEPDGRIRLMTGPPGKGYFEVLVPDTPEARSVAVFAGRESEGRATAAVQVAQYNLARPAQGEQP